MLVEQRKGPAAGFLQDGRRDVQRYGGQVDHPAHVAAVHPALLASSGSNFTTPDSSIATHRWPRASAI